MYGLELTHLNTGPAYGPVLHIYTSPVSLQLYRHNNVLDRKNYTMQAVPTDVSRRKSAEKDRNVHYRAAYDILRATAIQVP